MSELYDFTIVGGGPVTYSQLFTLICAKLKVKIIDSPASAGRSASQPLSREEDLDAGLQFDFMKNRLSARLSAAGNFPG